MTVHYRQLAIDNVNAFVLPRGRQSACLTKDGMRQAHAPDRRGCLMQETTVAMLCDHFRPYRA
jgi:hypothetical protein